MYNRYLQEHTQHEPEPILQFDSCKDDCNNNQNNNQNDNTGGILDSLAKRMGKVKLDTDTLILIAIIWFILKENGENEIDTELLVVLGILIFLGM